MKRQTLSIYIALSVLCCDYEPALVPVGGYENNDQVCNDGVDNDQDGLLDCEDPDCFVYSNYCGEIVPLTPFFEVENTAATCHDFIDNDDNGKFDCGDPKCKEVLENCCALEINDEACSDGLDNDQNGFADCQDFSCRQGMFVTVCEPERGELCGDGIDNDGDGLTDCEEEACTGFKTQPAEDTGTEEDPAAPVDCTSPEESEAACKDGFDNDGDGNADCLDEYCIAQFPNCASGESNLQACQDGFDNDGDGYFDCNDNSCREGDDEKSVEYCASFLETGLEKCSDGIDNDENGYPDCADYTCSLASETKAYCDERLENTIEKFIDGIDNDGNGYPDCADYSCARAFDIEVARACQESLVNQKATPAEREAEANARCQDGLDNDQDGFIDCDDWDCSWNPDVTVCTGPRVCE